MQPALDERLWFTILIGVMVLLGRGNGAPVSSSNIRDQLQTEYRVLAQAALPGRMQMRDEVERRYGKPVSVRKSGGDDQEGVRCRYQCGLVIDYNGDMVGSAWFEWDDIPSSVGEANQDVTDKWSDNDFSNAFRRLRQVLIDPSGEKAIEWARRKAAIANVSISSITDWQPILAPTGMVDHARWRLSKEEERRCLAVGRWYAINGLGVQQAVVDKMSVSMRPLKEADKVVVMLKFYDPTIIKSEESGYVSPPMGGFPAYFEIFLNGSDGRLRDIYAERQ